MTEINSVGNSAVETVDSLIHARWIVPVEDSNSERILTHHSIAIIDGKIVDILDSELARKRYRATDVTELSEHILIPGLINAHTHAAMSLFRGMADDLTLKDWLSHHIWPAEEKWVNEQFVWDGSMLAFAEMLRGGTTCFSDMYFFPNIVGKAAQESGIRANISVPILDFPSAWAQNADEYIHKGIQLHDDYRNHPLINVNFGPHAPYTVSDQPLSRIQTLAEEMDGTIQIHLHETQDEVEDAKNATGKRPIQRLHDLGLLTPRLQAVHMTQVDDNDLALLRDSGSHVIHCPESNLKLASGFCPTAKLMEAGINVALGTDGAASNNDLDMFSEMRTAALLAKAVAGDASALPAAQALKMATLNGAKALGIDDHVGSLEVGKEADIVAVTTNSPECQPVYHVISQLVYACNSDKVTDVWIAGRRMLDNQHLTTLDESSILKAARDWADKIAQHD
ncbi:MAG: TRZ/ATZ family hydrolase [Pseudomonadales bacterium]|nr:TRZ/ATZ family hydrolase [Pseudomonadales bacterium]